jgi:hypothetical protein
MASRDCDGVFSIGPLICQAHKVIDGLGLASSQLFSEVSPDETVPKSVDGSFGEMFSDVLCRLSHRDMYDLRLSPVFCMHRRSSSNDVGRREVPRKFAMKAC